MYLRTTFYTAVKNEFIVFFKDKAVCTVINSFQFFAYVVFGLRLLETVNTDAPRRTEPCWDCAHEAELSVANKVFKYVSTAPASHSTNRLTQTAGFLCVRLSYVH